MKHEEQQPLKLRQRKGKRMEQPEKKKEDLAKIQDGGSGQLHPPLAGRFLPLGHQGSP